MRHTAIAFLLFPLLLASTAGAADLTDLSEAERTALRSEIREFLLEEPGILIEMIAIIEGGQTDAKTERDRELVHRFRNEIENDGMSFVGGNPDGDVTIVEFLDYRCGYCKRAHGEIAALLRRDDGIRWIAKEFPILGPESMLAARMAVATLQTLGDEAYFVLHDVLMTHDGPVNAATLPEIASRADIDIQAIETAMQDPGVDEHIASVRALGQSLGIQGTPTFVIGDAIVRGYVPASDMQAIVARVRETVD